MKWLTIFDIIPSWVYALVVAVLVLGIAGQQVRVANAKTDLAEARLASEKKDREIADMRTKHESELRVLQAQHAKSQQEIIDAYDTKLAAGAAALASERARNERLREPAKRYTTIAPATGQSAVDAATIQSAQGRLSALGELLEEARGLVGEAGEIVRDRDAQVEALKAIIKADRAACSSATASNPTDDLFVLVTMERGPSGPGKVLYGLSHTAQDQTTERIDHGYASRTFATDLAIVHPTRTGAHRDHRQGGELGAEDPGVGERVAGGDHGNGATEKSRAIAGRPQPGYAHADAW